MDLEEVWKIRLDRFRFFWEEIYNRFWIRRLWWVQAEGQVVSTRPVSKNRIWEGSAAMADTIRGSREDRHSFPQRQSRDQHFP